MPVCHPFAALVYTGRPVRLAGIDAPVVVDLATLRVPRRVPVLGGHDRRRVAGATSAVTNTGKALFARGLLGGSDAAREAARRAGAGFAWGCSLGADAGEFEFVPAGKRVRANGRRLAGPVLVARDSALREVSLVERAADQRTFVALSAPLLAEVPTPAAPVSPPASLGSLGLLGGRPMAGRFGVPGGVRLEV